MAMCFPLVSFWVRIAPVVKAEVLKHQLVGRRVLRDQVVTKRDCG